MKKKIIENETTLGLIEKMLKTELANDEARLESEYRLAKDFAYSLFSTIGSNHYSFAALIPVKGTAEQGIPFRGFLLQQDKGEWGKPAERKHYVLSYGKYIRFEGADQLTLFILFLKCQGLECYPIYEKRLLKELFKKESTINPAKSVIAEWFK